jgi:O-antigen/teichoic acid export membrane protein
MSKKARLLARGSIFRMIDFFSVALVTLAMTPFVINSLGDNMYGLWIFVGSFLGYYWVMDFGLNSAIQRFLSRAIGAEDDLEANKVINTAIYIFAILGIMAFILSIFIAYFVPALIKNISEILVFRTVIIILGMSFAIGFPMRIFNGILTANLRYELSTTVELIKLFLRTALVIVFLKMGHGVIALAFITFFLDAGGYLMQYFIVKKMFPRVVFSRLYFDKTKIKSLFSYSTYTFISQVADQLRFNLDNLVITIFMGLNLVTLYSIASRLIKYFLQFMASAIGMLTPLFSQYEAIGDYESIRNKFLLTTKISAYLAILVGGLLVIFGKVFIQRWVGLRYLEAYPILLILLIPFVFDVMQIPGNNLLYGLSKHKYYSISNSIEGIVNLVLSIVLVKKYGLYGVALGTAIPMIVVKLFVQPVYTCHVIGLSWKKFYLSLILPVVVSATSILFIYWFMIRKFIMPNYVTILILSSAGILFFCIIIYKLGLALQERMYFKKIFVKT